MPRFAPLFALAVMLGANAARAADAETCARSYEAAQSRRQESKPVAARRELLVCAQDSCPAFVRRDCTQWLTEVNAEIPSIAVRVHGVDGCDRADADVVVDGSAAPRAAEGRLLELEPGSHTIRATVGDASTEQVVVVAPGEQHRLVVLDLGPRGAVCGAAPAPKLVTTVPTAPPPPDADARPPSSRPIPLPAWLLGGLAVASGGVAIGFGASAWSQKGTLDDCKGHCAQHDVDTMRRTFLVADVTMFVALASLGAATYLYLTRR